MSRLTPQQVLRIRERFAAGNTIKALAKAFSRHPDTISRVVNFKSHKRVRETSEQMPTPRTDESLKDLVDRDIAQHGTAQGRFRGPGRSLGVCPIFVAGWTQGKECGLQWEGLD